MQALLASPDAYTGKVVDVTGTVVQVIGGVSLHLDDLTVKQPSFALCVSPQGAGRDHFQGAEVGKVATYENVTSALGARKGDYMFPRIASLMVLVGFIALAGCEVDHVGPDVYGGGVGGGVGGGEGSAGEGSGGAANGNGGAGNGGGGGVAGVPAGCASNFECGAWTACRTFGCENNQCITHNAPDGTDCENGGTCSDGLCINMVECDDGNECTSDTFHNETCHFDAVLFPKACGADGHCWVGECCDVGRCWNMPASLCVLQCPIGQACNDMGYCQ